MLEKRPSLLERVRRAPKPILVSGVIVIGVLLLEVITGGRGSAEIAKVAQPTPTPADPRFEAFKGDCTTYGIAYEDPGENAEDRVKVFGPPDTEANLTTVAFFDYAVTLHPKVAACLEAVERDLIDQGTTYRIKEIGSYREERADRPYFFHQYGGAIDINPRTNPQCLEDLDDGREGVGNTDRCGLDRPYDLPDEWIETFERYGFYWGGNFSEGKDYMHFEWHGEKPS